MACDSRTGNCGFASKFDFLRARIEIGKTVYVVSLATPTWIESSMVLEDMDPQPLESQNKTV